MKKKDDAESSRRTTFCFYCSVHETGPDRLTENFGKYEGWNFNSGNYLFTTDTK